jgi:hypothetical protein
MARLSFQVNYAVYSCDNCLHRDYEVDMGYYCSYYESDWWYGKDLYRENEAGLTESCPVIKERKNV